jgi:hypothetical protein
LPAKTERQMPMSLLNVPAPSQASQLPQNRYPTQFLYLNAYHLWELACLRKQ